MRVKKVPLQDLELWPDEVICFTAYTDTRNPVQQRRTYVDGEKLKAKNAKLRADLETQCEVAAHNMNRNAREYKRACNENDRLRDLADRLRDLAKYSILCSEGDVRCEACPYHDKTAEPHIICAMRKAAIELGVEVGE